MNVKPMFSSETNAKNSAPFPSAVVIFYGVNNAP